LAIREGAGTTGVDVVCFPGTSAFPSTAMGPHQLLPAMCGRSVRFPAALAAAFCAVQKSSLHDALRKFKRTPHQLDSNALPECRCDNLATCPQRCYPCCSWGFSSPSPHSWPLSCWLEDFVLAEQSDAENSSSDSMRVFQNP